MKIRTILNNLPVSCLRIGLLIILPLGAIASQPEVIPTQNINLSWNAKVASAGNTGGEKQFLNFSGASYSPEFGHLPVFHQSRSGVALDQGSVTLTNEVYTEVPINELALLDANDFLKINNAAQISIKTGYSRRVPITSIDLIPFRKNPNSGKIEKLVSFNLNTNSNQSLLKVPDQKPRVLSSASVLSAGSWYRIGITQSGIYKISYSFLKNLGLDMTGLNPKNIRLYGNGGGMLPEKNNAFRYDDLVENPIEVAGENDGSFDASDYILFYGKGPHTWKQTASACVKFQHELNVYSDTAYYFINTDIGAGKRIQQQATLSATPTYTVNTFDDYDYRDLDKLNLIKSGRVWYGETMDVLSSLTYGFYFPNMDVNSPASVKIDMASRGTTANIYEFDVNGNKDTIGFAYIDPQDYSGIYARTGSLCIGFTPGSSTLTATIKRLTTGAVGWVNYVEANVRRNLILSGNSMPFRDSKSVGTGSIAQYDLTSGLPTRIWEITNAVNVSEQTTTSIPGGYSFIQTADSLREYIAFSGSNFPTPVYFGKVTNQNIHALTPADLIIVAHPAFMNEAIRLADHHSLFDSLSTLIVTPQQIFNEFSSGANDASAIRDFVKMLYDKAIVAGTPLPKYLLLFGDGSYDNKHRFSNNTNFITTYESFDSSIPTNSYTSDDFFGLLDNTEGGWVNGSDLVDIGIGRFPVKSAEEAKGVVNKIIGYAKNKPDLSSNNTTTDNLSKSNMGDWRNVICFVADDEDNYIHMEDADKLANQVAVKNPNLNIEKIYLDAYQQISTPGGNRYPDVTTAINKRMDLGALIFNYTGHGGELGLAHERILEISDIDSWKNINNMPFFVTATCEFSRYDDPERTSAGELVFLNPNGGGVSMLTTTRLVYANENYTLNSIFYGCAFTPVGNKMPRIGDIYLTTKVTAGSSVNNRNFTLLGDPALRIAYPENTIKTTTVNGKTVSGPDTARALNVITIGGFVQDTNGDTLKTFNGLIYPTVFDKSQTLTALKNDPSTYSKTFTFKLQKNILYKGKVSVTNGKFSFSFIVPKDIAYQFGPGRISYYGTSGINDATGYYTNIIIGGSSTNALPDNNGPAIKLYLNNDKFIFGGSTNENPQLYAIVKDSNGINTVGSGIGHDIAATLDSKSDGAIILNDYYSADLNSYKSGTIRYPFTELSEGKHNLKLKVWDVYNNSSEAYTEFVVAKSADLALSHVLNYPNPFTTKTQFYFEHNQSYETLDANIQIYTVTGKLIKTINTAVYSDGFRSQAIDWDGRDDYGDKIGRGVYIYKLKVATKDGKSAQQLEKLVILN